RIVPREEPATRYSALERGCSLIPASRSLALPCAFGMVCLHFLNLPDGWWMAVRVKPSWRGRSRWPWALRVTLVLGVHLFYPATALAQIDPLVYAAVAPEPRVTGSVTVAPDGAFLPDGSLLESRELTLQVTVEHPLRPGLALNMALAGSHLVLRVDGADEQDSLVLNHVALGLTRVTDAPAFGDHQVFSLETFLPLDPMPGRLGYRAEARAVWLHDPLALEVAGSARALPGRPMSFGWSGGVTFLANRYFSLAAQLELIDGPREAPTTIGSLTLYRHPVLPGRPMWGWGVRHAVEAGQ